MSNITVTVTVSVRQGDDNSGDKDGGEPCQEVGAAESAPSVMCAALTARGVPCKNRPQRGERFCGPHLSMGPSVRLHSG